MKVLANDGIDKVGKELLENAGFEVITEKVPQDQLKDQIKNYDVLIVRSATKVTADIITSSNLKLIGRAGVGLDNIDLKQAGLSGIPVVNTPNASSRSVAELVVAHLFSLARFLHESNRIMPENGQSEFKNLKNKASDGFELQGKKIGIIGFGRIGQEVAKIAIGLGMEVLVYDYKMRSFDLTIELNPLYKKHNIQITLKGQDLATTLSQSDIVTVHTPGSEEVIGEKEFAQMKNQSLLINCARGGVVNENALADAVNSGKIAFAGVDVFVNEPPTNDTILKLKNTSLSAHIGASTKEAQLRVGVELAERVIQHLKK